MRRLNIDITEEQYNELQKLPWGTRRVIYSNITDTLIEAMRVDPQATIGGFVTGMIKIVVKEKGEK